MNADASKRNPRHAPRSDPAPLADLDRRARERLLDKLIHYVDQADPADLNYAQLARAIRDLATIAMRTPKPGASRSEPQAKEPGSATAGAVDSSANRATPPDSTPASAWPAAKRWAPDDESPAKPAIATSRRRAPSSPAADEPRAPAARHRPDAPVRTADNKLLRSIFGDRVDLPRTLLDEAFADIYGLEFPPSPTPNGAHPPPAVRESHTSGGTVKPSRSTDSKSPNNRDSRGLHRANGAHTPPAVDGAQPPTAVSGGTGFQPVDVTPAARPTDTAGTPRGPPSPATSASVQAPD